MSEPLDPDDEMEWEAAMPFIVCESEGGPYEDQAFCAGFEMGKLDTELRLLAAAGGQAKTVVCLTASLAQLSLIAMRHGFIEVDQQIEGDWATVTLGSAS